MARTQIPLATFTSGADLNDAGTAIDQSNGMYIGLTSTSIPAANGSEDVILYVTNTYAGGVGTVTVRAGVGGGATAGAAMRSGLGDYTSGNLTASTGTAFLGPFESSRFMQSDGTLHLDFSASMTGKIWAIRVPRSPQI